jgi:triosephosphate isomerase
MIAGNWKMNLLRAEALDLVRAVRASTDAIATVEKVVCPPFVFLHDVKSTLEGSSIKTGAQNLYWEEKGAFTAEISVTQVAEVCEYVVIGHSERRQMFGETNETVNRRINAALAHGLKPIMCVGETLEQRQEKQTADVLVRQTREGLAGITISSDFIVAYEPVWAIGTGMAADGATAQEECALIRKTLRELSVAAADGVRILYGGSVTPDNVAEFIGQADIDGGLIGGASLKAESFSALVEGAAKSIA